ncbi:uncharacterized protein il12rb1 isoform X5 [Paramormyrops kingsleyae]|uniref:Interleukin 12 receptor subunit beta 1 n=1 Tax=Paramormyrops kingsleyae TaxID=1676925 RepID=A0A3B3RX58_9TELE|nr:interleukin-12 receptor subunit beta-1 isoform X4 [Paramormyrops kingsleyae]
MKEVACFSALLFVVLVEGQTSQPAHNVQCYKKTTDFDEDFTCTWRPVTPLQNATYKLFYQAPGQHSRHHSICTTSHTSCTVLRELLITTRTIHMWLEVETATGTYRSAELTVCLNNQVKYDAPEIKKISRSSKKLTLWWNKQSEEHRGAVYEISLKQLDHEHLVQETFETNDGQNTQENYTVSLHLEHNTNYEVMIRRRAKQVEAEIWSDWSQIKQVPTACPENRSKTTTNNKKRMELCVVWYRLTGETPKLADENHSTVKSTSQAFEIMNAEMEDFVRYHYFIYTKAKRGKQQITDMCPVYKKEGAPRSSPGSLTALNKTHNSAVLQWEPIPVSEQRGFLKNYIIYILGPNGTETVKVPGSQSNFTMQNLKHSSVYSVHLAGQTSVGVGPNTTETFQMKPNPPTKKGLPSFSVVTVTCLVAFFLMAFCILIVKCISDKLLPAVPSPVIPETPSYHTENHKEAYPVGEEVDSLILQLYEPSGGGGSEPRQMEVEVCRTPSYEQDDGESQSDSEEPDESSLALNPDYKKQILSGPAQLSHQQNRCDAIPAYKNGLVLEMRENASEELTESWPALG